MGVIGSDSLQIFNIDSAKMCDKFRNYSNICGFIWKFFLRPQWLGKEKRTVGFKNKHIKWDIFDKFLLFFGVSDVSVYTDKDMMLFGMGKKLLIRFATMKNCSLFKFFSPTFIKGL